MPFDHLAIMNEIERELMSYYNDHDYPSGDSKSLQFERAAVEVIKNRFDQLSTPQQGYTVEYLGGTVFPDVVVHIGTEEQKIGIEIKYHASANNWKTKGNSTYATTQIDGLEEIYILFGKFDHNNCSIKIRPYGQCIAGISITHNPRYEIDMETEVDFCSNELGISYDNLRRLTPEQRKIHINTYIAKTKYTTFSNIDYDTTKRLITHAFILFPEIFAKNPRIRYNDFSVWLFSNNVICKNVRDFLTAGGQENIDGALFPKVYVTFRGYADRIVNTIGEIPSQVLARAWYGVVSRMDDVPETATDRLHCWINLATTYHGGETSLIEKTPFNFKNTLSSWLGI